MPINIQNANISAAKLGISNVSKIFVGHNEIFPSTKEIQSAVFTDTSNLSYSGGTRVFRVTGEAGSTFNVSASNGSGGGSYTLGGSPEDINIAVSNTGCTGSARTITSTLTPTGSTVLQGGGSTFASSFNQTAGPGITNYTGTYTVAVTEVSKTTTTINGVVYYAAPTVWDMTITWNFGGLTASYIHITEQGLGMYNYPNHPDYVTNNLPSLTGGSSQIQIGGNSGWPSGTSGASGSVTVRWTSNTHASDGTTLLNPIIGRYKFSANAYYVVGSCQTFNGSGGSYFNANATIYP